MYALGPGQLIETSAIYDDVEVCKEQVVDNVLRNVNLETPVRHPVEMSEGLAISREGGLGSLHNLKSSTS